MSSQNKKVKCENTDDLYSEKNVSTLNNYLLNQYEIAVTILSTLSIIDLWNAAKVCKAWKSAAEHIIKKRQNTVSCLFKNNSDIKNLNEIIFIEPKICISFVCSRSVSPISKVKKIINSNCSYVCVGGEGIVGANDFGDPIEIQKKSQQYFSCLFIPNIPDVQYSVFELDATQCKMLNKISDDNLESVENLLHIPQNTAIKCLLLFCTLGTSWKRHISSLVTSIYKRQKHGFALGGGCVNSFRIGTGNGNISKHGERLIGIAFYGKNVSASSLILEPDINTESKANEVIHELKQSNAVYKKNIIFMFACIGRGCNYYFKHNVESQIIRKHFPDSHIIGYFGNGEIGMGYKDLEDDDNSESHDSFKCPKLFHSFTTVLVSLSFKM